MSINWPRFVEIVRNHQRFLLTSHVRPDCDALGSELGMAGALDALDKQVAIVNGQATPPNLAFIDPKRRLKTLGIDVQPSDLASYEVLMILDTSAWAQLGPMGDVVRSTGARKIIVDHHVSQDDLGAEAFKDVEAEATGRLVLEAVRKLGVTLTPEIATPLFAAVATDTGWFRFASTTSNTFAAGSELVDAGARPDLIFNQLYEQDTLARLNLRGRILASARTEFGGRLAISTVFRRDFDETGALPSDTEDVVNMTLTVAGTEVATIFVELPKGGFKVSFRSRTPKVDCNEIAGLFGGGGHKAAAGATINEPWETARAKVLDALRGAMQ